MKIQDFSENTYNGYFQNYKVILEIKVADKIKM